MSLSIKSGARGARVLGLRSEVVLALMVANDVFKESGFDCVITAGIDGSHSRGSIHYKALAADLRANHIPQGERAGITEKIKVRLGDDYDVILEGDGTPNVHWHIEFDPKSPINA